MNSRYLSTLLVISLVAVAVLGHASSVGASRVLPDDFAGESHLETYSSVYENAKQSLAFWLQKLSSGPSPSGPGH
ncbi:Transmembrane protein [Parasponia andersonii]|uniref:Transmembrane protein n=1 Tax=Parasponia andersonii TaxID=3476 RepID=A0A2P5DWN8_PARAD|nr:Transmembrane protein [Parasponia andersonii]